MLNFMSNDFIYPSLIANSTYFVVLILIAQQFLLLENVGLLVLTHQHEGQQEDRSPKYDGQHTKPTEIYYAHCA